MAKERIHREWFQPIKKTSCLCGKKKVQCFAWGEYVRAKWRTVDHFCQDCFPSIAQRIVSHASGCGCVFEFCARSGHGPLPEWLKVPEVCALKKTG